MTHSTFLLGCGVVLASHLCAQTQWTQLAPATQPDVIYQTIVSTRSNVLMYGSTFTTPSTWTWDGTDWSERVTTSVPPRRANPAMAYDPLRDRVVFFGGDFGPPYLGDTWEWDGTDWIALTPANNPPARTGAAMAFDHNRGRVVLFGGSLGPLSQTNDMWEWTGTDWRDITPATVPPTRVGNAMAFDEAGRRLVLVRWGTIRGLQPSYDTWTYDGATWREEYPPESPQTFASTAAFDPERGRVVLDNGWEWTGSTWSRTGTPSAGQAHDPVAGGMLETRDFSVETWRFETAALARFDLFGSACLGSPSPRLTPAPYARPWIGEGFAVGVDGLVPGQAAAMIVGSSRTSWMGLSLPFALEGLGMTGCRLYVAMDVVQPVAVAGGSATWVVSVPDDAALAGAEFFTQALGIAPGANPLGVLVSDAGRAAIGVR